MRGLDLPQQDVEKHSLVDHIDLEEVKTKLRLMGYGDLPEYLGEQFVNSFLPLLLDRVDYSDPKAVPIESFIASIGVIMTHSKRSNRRTGKYFYTNTEIKRLAGKYRANFSECLSIYKKAGYTFWSLFDFVCGYQFSHYLYSIQFHGRSFYPLNKGYITLMREYLRLQLTDTMPDFEPRPKFCSLNPHLHIFDTTEIQLDLLFDPEYVRRLTANLPYFNKLNPKTLSIYQTTSLKGNDLKAFIIENTNIEHYAKPQVPFHRTIRDSFVSECIIPYVDEQYLDETRSIELDHLKERLSTAIEKANSAEKPLHNMIFLDVS